MLVVSDTSPISNLAIIDRLWLLEARYGKVVIPPVVERELMALSHEEGRRLIQAAMLKGWLVVTPLTPNVEPIGSLIKIDPGETEAILLARSLPGGKLLLDDSRARKVARELGIKVSGLLGELVAAKNAKRLASVKEEIGRLRTEARFFVSADVEAVILAGAGE